MPSKKTSSFPMIPILGNAIILLGTGLVAHFEGNSLLVTVLSLMGVGIGGVAVSILANIRDSLDELVQMAKQSKGLNEAEQPKAEVVFHDQPGSG